MAKDSMLETMKLYLEGSKSFVQLSSAGLALPVVLKSSIFGLFGKTGQFSSLQLTIVCLSWMCFLVSIGAGVLYQYVAVKFIESESHPKKTYVPSILKGLVREPGRAYGVMVVAFYAGAVSVVVYSLAALLA